MVHEVKEVKQFNEAIRNDPNGIFVTFDMSNGVKMTVINNITDEVFNTPNFRTHSFEHAFETCAILYDELNTFIDNLSDEIKSKMHTFAQLEIYPDGETILHKMSVNEF